MKTTHQSPSHPRQHSQSVCASGILGLCLTFGWAGNAAYFGNFAYEVTQSTVTITAFTPFELFNYTGPVGIPGTIDGLPVTRIGDSAFAGGWSSYGIVMTSVTIPNSVVSIGTATFHGCTGLTNVTIPNSVTNIGEGAFAKCSGLTAIMVEPDNPAYCSLAGVLFNKSQTRLFQCPGGKAGDYTIPIGVTRVEGSAFQGCTNLTSVTIPEGVTSIGRSAFLECSGLSNLTIPGSVIGIEGYAFFLCTNLANVTISQ